MIEPINGHILIEPVKHEEFIQAQRQTFEEIGTVLALPKDYTNTEIKVGDKVYFDSWLAAKYPKNPQESYWLIKYTDVRAVEHA